MLGATLTLLMVSGCTSAVDGAARRSGAADPPAPHQLLPSPDEVAAAVGCPPSDVVVLPVDRAGASLITNSVSSRWLRRAALARTIRAMALELWPVASDDGVLV